jgi:hypothetical protein
MYNRFRRTTVEKQGEYRNDSDEHIYLGELEQSS